MFPENQRLRTLKVGDVMSRKLIEVSANQTMCEAAKAFAVHQVASAPVVDEQGRCVGMLSAVDFIKRDCPQHDGMSHYELATQGQDDCLSIEPTRDIVSCYMSTGVQSVTAEASLLQAAREMAIAHIHHLPVLENDRPIGVVSTMDVVAAVINAVDEVDAR